MATTTCARAKADGTPCGNRVTNGTDCGRHGRASKAVEQATAAGFDAYSPPDVQMLDACHAIAETDPIHPHDPIPPRRRASKLPSRQARRAARGIGRKAAAEPTAAVATGDIGHVDPT